MDHSTVCGRCGERPASAGCKSCSILFCKECRQDVHIGGLAAHQFTDPDTFLKLQSRVCQTHQAPLELYCFTCTKIICILCASGQHKEHEFLPVAEAKAGVPPLPQLEAALREVAAEMATAQAVLRDAQATIERDGKASLQLCRDLFTAFVRSVEADTKGRVALVKKHMEDLDRLHQHTIELVAQMPAAKTEFFAQLEVHCKMCALAREMPAMEITVPRSLHFKTDSNDTTAGGLSLTLPTLPPPFAGNKHLLRGSAYGSALPCFRPQYAPFQLLLSNRNRRCAVLLPSNALSDSAFGRDSRGFGLGARDMTNWSPMVAMAQDGLINGKKEFTVHVIKPSFPLCIGVAAAGFQLPSAHASGIPCYGQQQQQQELQQHRGVFFDCETGSTITSPPPPPATLTAASPFGTYSFGLSSAASAPFGAALPGIGGPSSSLGFGLPPPPAPSDKDPAAAAAVKPFQKVTVQLDFVAGVAHFKADGRSVGKATLPQGPLFPTIIFYRPGAEVEFVIN